MRVRWYEDVTYQLLTSLCAVRFVRKCAILKHNKMYRYFLAVSEEDKILHTAKKTVLFFCWYKSLYWYRVNLLYRTACSYLLFNLRQSIRCVSERSIQNILMFSQSQCCLYQEQPHVSVSTDCQHNVPKQYKNAIHINSPYIAFSVLDHNSLQSLVIQQLAVTELFCTA